MQIRNIISSYAVNKIVSSLNLNKEIVAESDLLESSFKEIKSNPSGKSDNDFFIYETKLKHKSKTSSTQSSPQSSTKSPSSSYDRETYLFVI